MAGLLLPAGLPLSAWGADQCKPFPDTAWLTDFAIPSFSAAIDPDAPNGTVLHSQYVVLNGKSVSFDCSEVPGRLQSYLYGRLEPIGANGTWPTSVNGIGVKIRQTEGDTRQWPIFRAMDPNVTLVSFLPNPVIIEFVKTGAIPLNGGSLTMIGELAGIWIRNNTQQVVSYRIAGGITIKPKPPVCTVTSPSPIAFGSMSAHSFPASVGATTPEKSLTIRVRAIS
jgi:hypothetical protein